MDYLCFALLGAITSMARRLFLVGLSEVEVLGCALLYS